MVVGDIRWGNPDDRDRHAVKAAPQSACQVCKLDFSEQINDDNYPQGWFLSLSYGREIS